MFQRNNSPSPTLPNLDSSFQSSVFFSTFARENVPPTSKPTTKPHTEISIDPFRGSHWASQTHSHPSAEHLHLAAIFFLLEICEKTMGESKILGGGGNQIKEARHGIKTHTWDLWVSWSLDPAMRYPHLFQFPKNIWNLLLPGKLIYQITRLNPWWTKYRGGTGRWGKNMGEGGWKTGVNFGEKKYVFVWFQVVFVFKL